MHDYQLQLVPQLLRRLRPDVRIGFFLHIPFPPVELFMRLPWRTQIISGLLGADLIGFQLPGGARNFARLAKSLAGAVTTGGTIEYDGRTIRAGAYPISIDSAEQSALAATPRDPRRRQAAPGRPRQPEQDHPGGRPARLHQGHRRPAAGVRRAAGRGATRRSRTR